MKTVCCSNDCERRFECSRYETNNDGINLCEDFYKLGFSSTECEEAHACGDLGNWKMFEQIDHEWIKLREKAPPINEEVELKVIYEGQEKIFVNKLIPMTNGKYVWAYCDYYDCDEVVSWRKLPKYQKKNILKCKNIKMDDLVINDVNSLVLDEDKISINEAYIHNINDNGHRWMELYFIGKNIKTNDYVKMKARIESPAFIKFQIITDEEYANACDIFK